ncbi:MAG: TRAP transporter small permease [Spirochaetaceae bacterium]|nr:TRAP transporter small permease [Spirochaetaceae bacterium]
MNNVLKHFEEVLGCFLLAVYVGLTVLNVILRYCFNFILSWAEEVIVIAFLWSVFLGAITAFRLDRHVAIDVIVTRLPRGVQRVLYVAIDLLILALTIYITYLGVILCMNVGVKTTYTLKISFVYIDAALVVSFGLMSVFGIIRLVLRAQGRYETADSITRTLNEVEGMAAENFSEEGGEK